MKKGDAIYQQYLDILAEELRPAMGCTEPIALAYAGAKARELLGAEPTRVEAWVSGNIIKNVKSVIVPNTGGLCGIAAAVCAGIVAGDPEKELQVISQVTPEQQQQLRAYLETAVVEIQPSDSELVFDIDLRLYREESSVRVRIINHHTNLVYIEKNGEVLLQLPVAESSEDRLTDKSCLSMERIVDFVVKNSKLNREKFTGMMLKTGELSADVGSVIYGQEAVELGLIDHLGSLSDALDCLHGMIRKNKEKEGMEGKASKSD